MKQQAAGVFVTNGPRILAFRRHDAEGLSLPCGKIEPGEDPAEAARREAKEETGLDIEIVSNQPFVGFDLEGSTLVHTYRGKVIGGELLSLAQGEGTPLWASLSAVAHGPYWHYNQRAMRHFGVTIPISGKFHSHLTIEANSKAEGERAAALVRGKITMIDLQRDGRKQTDYMITHHYVTGHQGLEDQYDVTALLKARAQQLKESGIRVLRAKLEHEMLDLQSNRRDIAASLASIYTEVHVKCVIDNDRQQHLINIAKAYGWHPSLNPFAVADDGKVTRFVNRRFYDDVALATIDRAVDELIPAIIPFAHIKEIKYESAIFDSNVEHDRWWMQ